MSQTTLQRENAVRFGSAKMEIGPDVGSLVDFGALRSVRAAESWDERQVLSDNAGVLNRGIRNQKIQVTANWMEPDLELLNNLRGGIDTYGTTAASKVDDHAQVISGASYAFQEFIVAEHQNADGSLLQIDETGVPTVSGSIDGALVEGTDFIAMKDGAGNWGIAILDSATVTTMNQIFTYTYDYTPAASKDLSSGGKFSISPRVVRLTNTDDDSKDLVLLIYKAYVTGPADWPFPGDEADDALPMPIQITGELDTSRSAGDQLYAITDAQSIT